jgi:uncharacterized protein (TIGR03437 family)
MLPLRSWLAVALLSGVMPAAAADRLARADRNLRLGGGAATTAAAGAPVYAAEDMEATCNHAPGPFAPNMEVTMKGTGLANSTRALAQDDIADGRIPTVLNGVRVFVDGFPAPLFYVSDTQVNFLIPGNEIAGEATVWLVRESLVGPQVKIQLLSVAPALFPQPDAPEYAIAQLWPAYSLIEPGAPAPAAGGIVILYAAGLGDTEYFPQQTDRIPTLAGQLTNLKDFRVYLNGKPLDSLLVLYAGICPGWSGLYQINFFLPFDAGTDPEIRVGIGQQLSASGLKLAVR